MIAAFKGRTLEQGQLVKVYFNLHKKVFSVKDAVTGHVLAHGNHVIIKEPTFQVNEKSRQRVIKTRRKNVHAYVVGTFDGIGELHAPVKRQYDNIHYNPYTQDKFTVGQSNVDANNKSYEFAIMSDKKVLAR